MSSALPQVAGMARAIVRRMAPLAMRNIINLGMTPRQQELNHFWSWYATCRYDARKVDWDGTERVDRVDAEAIATAGVLPGGFYDAAKSYPLKFRRPTAPYHLPRVIVNRFTGLLFSESQHPKLRCIGDPDLEDYATALADYARLWAAMIQVRTFGGGTGSFCVGFKFIDGAPQIEVHDPRWVTPKFKNRETFELKSIEKRWMWPDYVPDEKGEFEEVWYWTRRIIDEEVDVVWHRVQVNSSGEEPNWEEHQPDLAVAHGFGECPVVWGQNIPVSDHEDGEPDCLGVYDMVEEMDALISQATTATKRNLDPTTLIFTDMKLRDVLSKGSDNAVKLEKGASVSYLEMTGSGQKEALDEALKLRGLVLEITQCVLDHEDDTSSGQETATRSRMRYASMTAKADQLREQYGQKCVLPVINKMIRAIRKLSIAKPGAAPDGGALRQTIILPPREITGEDGTKSYEPRVLPEKEEQKGSMTLLWPPYFPPSLQDALAAANAVKSAKDAMAISDETAAHFLAPYFGVDDVPAEILKIKAEAKEHEAEMKAKAAASWSGGG